MKSELTPGWNVFKQIFHDHWDEFKQFHPRYDHAYYDELVNKMPACGNPNQIGYLDYQCLDCGQGKHLVAMSCKSALCLRCAKVYVDEFVSQVSHRLHEGVISVSSKACHGCAFRSAQNFILQCLPLARLGSYS